MSKPENLKAAMPVPKPSIIFNAWKKLLAKRKNSFSIRVLCVVLISIATVFTWMIQLFLEFIANLPEVAAEISEESENTELNPPKRDDPWSDFSMSLNGYD